MAHGHGIVSHRVGLTNMGRGGPKLASDSHVSGKGTKLMGQANSKSNCAQLRVIGS